jgi:hypothetical protein
MYEDLESIATLRIAQVVERASRENQTKLSASIRDLASRGHVHPDSGPVISARLNSAFDTSQQLCRGLCEIWLDLILRRNHDRISRADVDFVKAWVDTCAQAQIHNLGICGSFWLD